MEKVASTQKIFGFVLVITAIAMISLMAGMMIGSKSAQANEAPSKGKKVIYPKNTELNFEGTAIEGEVRNPGEFYFQHRPQEKFDSLVKRRKNFHQEMMRDVVLSK